MTIPPALLDNLAARETTLVRNLSPEQGSADCDMPEWGEIDEKTFKWNMSMDGAANDKLAAGLRAFASDTDKLVSILRDHPQMDLINY